MRQATIVRLVVLALSVVFVALPGPASALTPIQPGSRMSIVDLDGERRAIGSCSLGYVFDGRGDLAGKVYISTAAHCATDVGDDVMLLETGEVFGDYAAIGDLRTSPCLDDASLACPDDWALIEVRPEYRDRVSAAFKGYPQYPTGYTNPGQTKEDDPIRQTDWPYGGVPRQATMVNDTDAAYVISGPVIPFDSGGPLAHIDSGEALGLVSRGHNCQLPSLSCQTYSGPTVQGILARAADAGFAVKLRTV